MKKMKSLLEELKTNVNDLFGKAEDGQTVQKLGAINKMFEDAEKEREESEKEYSDLLTNYKDAVIHGGYKPAAGDDGGQEFDPDAALANALEKYAIK